MQITRITIDFKNLRENVLAYATVTFEGVITIECPIIKGKYGEFVCLPKGKRNNFDKYHDLIRMTGPIYKYFQKSVIDSYNRKIVEIAEIQKNAI